MVMFKEWSVEDYYTRTTANIFSHQILLKICQLIFSPTFLQEINKLGLIMVEGTFSQA
jgi:hypothetical protein